MGLLHSLPGLINGCRRIGNLGIELLHGLVDDRKRLVGLIKLRIKLLEALAGLLGALREGAETLLVLAECLLESGAELVELPSQTGNLLRKLGELLFGLAQALLPCGGIYPKTSCNITNVGIGHTLSLDNYVIMYILLYVDT